MKDYYYPEKYLREMGVVAHEVDTSYLPVKKRREIVAFCKSEECKEKSQHKRGTLTEAPKTATFCPNCGHALIWEPK